MAASELPALALFAAISLALLWKAPRQTLLAYVPGAQWLSRRFFRDQLDRATDRSDSIHASQPGDNWYDYTYQRNGKEIESYWRHPSGIDQGEQSRGSVCFSRVVGHHGIFSLTPIWLLTLAGMFISLWPGQDRRLRNGPILIGGVSLICIVFYLFRPLGRAQLRRDDKRFSLGVSGLRRYGSLIDAARRGLSFQTALDPGFGLGASYYFRLLGRYPTWNPWTNPWIMDYMKYLTGINAMRIHSFCFVLFYGRATVYCRK